MTVKLCNKLALGAPQIRIEEIYRRFFIHLNTYYAWPDFLRYRSAKQTLGEVETKHLFNSQWCQKYFCQKLLKSANLSSSYDR